MPIKPEVEACFPELLDKDNRPLEKPYCLCGMTNGAPKNKIELLVSGRDLVSKPIEYCDKATAFPPPSWAKYHNYVDQLEIYIKDNCSNK